MTNIVPFRRSSDDGFPSRRNVSEVASELTGAIVGRSASDLCLHLRLSGASGLAFASAPIWCRERIVESGFPAGPAVALFTGRDLDGSAAFATVSTSDWRLAVLRLTGTPSFTFAERVHLLSWPAALQPRTRRAMSAEIGRRIAVQGGARRLGRSATNHPRTRNDVGAVASVALLLIAATYPGTFDGSPV